MTEVITKIKLSINLLNEQSLKAKENDEIKQIIYLDGQIEAYTQCLIILQEAKMEDLTKQEAIDAMLIGKKVTHKYFSEKEWIRMENGKIISEDGVVHDEFWKIRDSVDYLNDWSIFVE